MATRRLFPALSHKPARSVASHGTGMRRRHDFDPSSATANGSQQHQRRARRPPKQQQQQQQQQQRHNSTTKKSRPTHFLALPIGHHPELRNAMSALTSSWLEHEPPIEGLDPSIVVHPRRLHLTLGVMTLAPAPAPDPNPSSEGQERGTRGTSDLAGATALLESLAPRIRTVLAQSPLRVPLGRLAIMQSEPERAHVLYAEPDVRSPDGRRLRAVCGACCNSLTTTLPLPYFFL
jgi:activating signal cointegrator complex subunit 1